VTYDIGRPTITRPDGKTIDGPLLNLMLMQVVLRRWSWVLDKYAAMTLFTIVDRTAGWNRTVIKTTVDELITTQIVPGGPREPMPGLSRRTTFRSLSKLREMNLIQTKRLQSGLIIRPNFRYMMAPWPSPRIPPPADEFPFEDEL